MTPLTVGMIAASILFVLKACSSYLMMNGSCNFSELNNFYRFMNSLQIVTKDGSIVDVFGNNAPRLGYITLPAKALHKGGRM